MVVWGVSVDTTIIHTFLSVPACTDMVYSKELECDVTTTAVAKELQHLITLASFLRTTLSVRFFYIRKTNKYCYVHAMFKMCLF